MDVEELKHRIVQFVADNREFVDRPFRLLDSILPPGQYETTEIRRVMKATLRELGFIKIQMYVPRVGMCRRWVRRSDNESAGQSQ